MKQIILIFTLLTGTFSFAQKGKTFFGVQLNPIIPNRYIGQFEQTYAYDSIPFYDGMIKQRPGMNFGMVVRHGITNTISIESGITYTRRSYNISYNAPDSGFASNNNLTLINYNIPINGLVYIQLADDWFMNASAGINLSFYPTSVFTQAPIIDVDHQFYQVGTRTSWVQTGVNANYGFEYRHKDAGTFYMGASYSLPFSPIMDFIMTWRSHGVRHKVYEEINGSYLTFDFKYFFPTKKY